MSLGTLDSSPPPFFKQGPSTLSRLVFYSALAVFCMVADTRLKISSPLRQGIAAVLAPVEWVLNWPIVRFSQMSGNIQDLKEAQTERDNALALARSSSQEAQRAEQLAKENDHLRALLELKPSQQSQSIPAEVLYESRDPFTRKFTLSKGSALGVEAGMPVIDEKGVIGQVTRVYLVNSEVSAITDRDMAVPVQNLRTSARSVAYGDPSVAGALELRFTPANADVKEGDLLVTSGLDGVYPAGLAVAKIWQIQRKAESAFAKILCAPVSGLDKGRHVLILHPLNPSVPPTPGVIAPVPEAPAGKKRTTKPAGQAPISTEPQASSPEGEPVAQPMKPEV